MVWRLCLLVMMCVSFAACEDEGDSNGDGDAVDTSSADDTALTFPDTSDSDTGEDTGPEIDGCVPERDTKCVGDDKRVVCSELGGELAVEACPSGELCYAGACAPVTCEPFTVESCLEDGRYQGCNPQGTGEGEFNCPQGTVCVDGDCNPRLCGEGESLCQDDKQVLVCNALGSGFIEGSRCGEGDEKTICDNGECVPLCEASVKTQSYVGCDYWAVDLDNALDGPYNAAGQQFAVVVSNATGELPAVVRAYEKKGFEAASQRPLVEVVVPVGGLEILRLPPDCYPDSTTCEPPDRTPYDVNGTTIGPHAYRITSDVPITAYQFNPLDNVQVFSNDASILFPSTSIGSRYLVMSRRQGFDTLRGFMTVVGTEPGVTNVTVTTTARTLDGVDVDGEPIARMERGDSRTFQLGPFDVLNLETDGLDEDFTGTTVVADGRVVVFGGHEAADVPDERVICDNGSEIRTQAADHLEQQLYPINAWGVDYLAAKSFQRNGERDFWRIMARFDDTVVETFPEQLDGPRTLQAGEWFEFASKESFEISANRPIMVGQFLSGIQDPVDPERCGSGPESAGIGDPTFILGVPREQYRQDYVFLVPRFYEQDYITVVAPVGATVELDEVALAEDVFEVFGNGDFMAARLPVEDGVHSVSASEPTGVFVYGFDGSVSYGYPAGLNLINLFE